MAKKRTERRALTKTERIINALRAMPEAAREKVLATLTPMERDIIVLRYGLGKPRVPKPPHQDN